jgi:hypothetical protein
MKKQYVFWGIIVLLILLWLLYNSFSTQNDSVEWNIWNIQATDGIVVGDASKVEIEPNTNDLPILNSEF